MIYYLTAILQEVLNMYAIIKSGGKQYKVYPDLKLKLEKIAADVGDVVEFEAVFVKGDDGDVKFSGKVVVEVVSHGLGKKVTVFKYKPKKNYKRWKGHRQKYTEVLIKEIKEV